MADQIGEYVLEAELGRGGMGVVHRARHRPTGALRALKVLTGAADPEVVARFRREAEALARVGGDAVVPVHEVVVERGRLAIAMGLMSGGSLQQRLRATGRLEWREVVSAAIVIARALERCHAAGLVHRDLKPANVLIDDEGRPRLADFGIVRDLTAATLTESGTVMGTPRYMAPEQLEGSHADARADVYALGVLIHELVTGKAPFDGRSPYDLFRLKVAGWKGPLPEGTPLGLGAVIGRALRPDAAARYQAVEAMRRDLEALVPGKGTKPVRTRRRRRPWVLLAGAGALVLAGTGPFLRLRVGPPISDDSSHGQGRRAGVMSSATIGTASIESDRATELLRRAENSLRKRRYRDAANDVKRAVGHPGASDIAKKVVDASFAEAEEAARKPRADAYERALEVWDVAHALDVPISRSSDIASVMFQHPESGAPDERILDVDRAVEFDPVYALSLANAALKFTKRREISADRACDLASHARVIAQVNKLDPDYRRELDLSAEEVLLRSDRWKEALALVGESLAEHKDQPRHAMILGRNLVHLGTSPDLDRVLEERVDEIVRYVGENHTSMIFRATALARVDRKRAIESLDAVEDGSADLEHRYVASLVRVDIAKTSGHPEEALALYRRRDPKMEGLEANYPADLKIHAGVLVSLAKFEEAGRILERNLRTKGKARLMVGKTKEDIPSILSALEDE